MLRRSGCAQVREPNAHTNTVPGRQSRWTSPQWPRLRLETPPADRSDALHLDPNKRESDGCVQLSRPSSDREQEAVETRFARRVGELGSNKMQWVYMGGESRKGVGAEGEGDFKKEKKKSVCSSA